MVPHDSGVAPAGVTLERRGVKRWLGGHPWIYASDVAGGDGLQGGEVVRVFDGRGRCLGQAFWSHVSKIRLRRLTFGTEPVDDAFFAARLAAADARRRALLPGCQAYRVVHGEADGLPGLVVDRYGDWLGVQLLVPAMAQRRALIVRLLVEHFAPAGIVNRSDVAARELEGLAPEKGVLHGTVPDTVVIEEGGMKIGISLLEGQKTGAFLDQRPNRIAAAGYARGRALDCFSYAGGFALQLATRATQVTALDISSQACAQIAANVVRNGCTNIEVVCANVFEWLRARDEAGARYDTVVLDPPAFVKHKSALAAGLRGYKEINLRAMRLMAPGGCLITASCSHHVDEAAFEVMLQDAAADARRDVQVLERRGPGVDHPVLLAMRETRYLKTYVLRVL